MRILTIAMLMMFGVALVGCEAGARVDEPGRTTGRVDTTAPHTAQTRPDHRERPVQRDGAQIRGEIQTD
jgi:hypothetical protein